MSENISFTLAELMIVAASEAWRGNGEVLASGLGIARRLQDDGGPALFVAAAVGALLTLAADVLGQHAVPGVVAPVGIVTGLIGAPYLLFLLARQRKVAA